MSFRKLVATMKMIVQAGQATPAGSIGANCGQKGVNSKAFCDLFNAQTQNLKKGIKLHVHVFVYENKTFEISFHNSESTSSIIKSVLQLKKGASKVGTENIGIITRQQLEEVAKLKFLDTTSYSLENAIKIVAGTARSMGLGVQNV